MTKALRSLHLLFMLMLASKVKARLYKAGERTLLLSTSSARWRLGEEPNAMLAELNGCFFVRYSICVTQ